MAVERKKPARESDPAEILLDSIGFLLNKAAQRLRDRQDPLLAPLGLTGKLLSVLKILGSEGAHTQHELGALGCIDRSTAVVLIDALEKAGLVARGSKPGDRRAHVVALTAKGVRTLGKGRKIEAKMQREYLACLENRERRTLLALLRRLVQAHTQGFL